MVAIVVLGVLYQGGLAYLGSSLHPLLLLSPVGPALPQRQAGVGQLQGELRGLQACLVQLALPVVPLGHRTAQLAPQGLGGALAGAQALPQAPHLVQGRAALRLLGEHTHTGARE